MSNNNNYLDDLSKLFSAPDIEKYDWDTNWEEYSKFMGNFIKTNSRKNLINFNVVKELFLRTTSDFENSARLEEGLLDLRVFQVNRGGIEKSLDGTTWIEIFEGLEGAWEKDSKLGMIVNEVDGVVTWLANDNFLQSVQASDEEIMEKIFTKLLEVNTHRLELTTPAHNPLDRLEIVSPYIEDDLSDVGNIKYKSTTSNSGSLSSLSTTIFEGLSTNATS